MSKDPAKSDHDAQAGREPAETAPAPDKDTAGDSPLIAKLKKQKVQKSGEHRTTLPESGITVTWPKFQSHGAWMKAQRLAKKDVSKATNFYLTGICKFDGERMTVTEFVDLIPTVDVFHLMGEVMGDDDDEDNGDDAGNALH